MIILGTTKEHFNNNGSRSKYKHIRGSRLEYCKMDKTEKIKRICSSFLGIDPYFSYIETFGTLDRPNLVKITELVRIKSFIKFSVTFEIFGP